MSCSKKYVAYVVLDIYPCAIGGMEIFYSKLLPEMAKIEDVALITACKKIESTSFRILRIPKKLFSIRGTGRFATLLFAAKALIKDRRNIKLVHLPYTSNAGRWGFVFPLLTKMFGIKYLLHIHGGGMKPWKKLNADKALFKYASKLLAVSDITKKEYEKRTGRTIEVVFPLIPFISAPESKDEIKLKLKFNPNDKIILFVGSLKELKAPDVLFEAFLQLDESFIKSNNLRLVFVGDGNLREELKNKVSSTSFQQYVTFTGKIPYSEIPQYYRIADIYVIPSKFEGTPKSLLEAMFNKLPVIGSNVNGINNILTHNENALLFDTGKTVQLSRFLSVLIMNDEKSKDLAQSAFNHYYKQFKFENTVYQLKNIYNF